MIQMAQRSVRSNPPLSSPLRVVAVLLAVLGGCGGGGGGGDGGPLHVPLYLSGDPSFVRIESDGRVSMNGHGGELGPLALTLAFSGAPDATIGYDARGLPPLPDPYRLDPGAAKGQFTITVAPEEIFGFQYNAGEEQIFLTSRGGIHLLVDARALTAAPTLVGNVLTFQTGERGKLATVVDRVAVFDGDQLLAYQPTTDFSVDGDGDLVVPPLDCNDGDPGVSPLADEIAGDGVDQNCDGLDIPDLDRDGFPSAAFAGGTDCNDDDPSIHPGVPEVLSDGIDNDCDGVQANDDDRDGFQHLVGGTDPGPDCNDEDASIFPGAPEAFGQPVDHNCNGVVPGAKIMGVGDSITDGTGDPEYKSHPELAGYPPRLADLLGIPRSQVANRGRGSTLSEDGVGTIDRDLGAEHPDLVIVLFGANDSFDLISVNAYMSNIQEIVLHSQAAGAKVIISGVLHVCCGRIGPPEPIRNERIDEYDAALERLASDTGSTYVRLEEAFEANGGLPALLADGLHPNATGYSVMAAQFAAAIQTSIY